MTACENLAKILGVDDLFLGDLEKEMAERTGKRGVLEKIAEANEEIITRTLRLLNSQERSVSHVRSVLRKVIFSQENYLLGLINEMEGKDEFEKAIKLARKIANVSQGFFLKKEKAKEILYQREPEGLLRYLKAKNIDEVLANHDIDEIFSALRFVETTEWMHKTFEVVYSHFTADDFEKREIEIKVLGPEWKAISKKFVAKKHHNVSHLKEFGVIFLNPIRENIPGKFLRDFALLLHYFHELEFYSKLFEKYAKDSDFAEKLKSLLRGDVLEIYHVNPGEWLIVQRYLAKENPNDPRLFLPRVNSESLHWTRGERDLISFRPPEACLDLKLWRDLDWVGGIFKDDGNDVVSFDLEDNAMSLVSFMEGGNETFNYHQRESMWTKIFEEYAGSEDKMEKLLIDNFDKGVIRF